MTPKAQRLAIARACRLDRIAPLREMKGGWHYLEESHGGADTWAPVPLYLQDLNAMHCAEMSLSDRSPGFDSKGNQIPSDRARYRLILCEVTLMSGGPIHATAAQRAEAFLRTLNLWTP